MTLKDSDQPMALNGNSATQEFPEAEDSLLQRDAVSRYLAIIGRRGGIKGGKARAQALTAQQRSEIARNAAQSRWSRGKE